MAFLYWLSTTVYAVDNNNTMGVYKCTPEEAADYKAAISNGGRIKYTPNPGKKVGSAADAVEAHHAKMFRAGDQKSPCGTVEYDDGDGYSERHRYIHDCPWSGKSWVVETIRKISGY
jgi:hypothetical protein